ncbi:hypothetical protein 2 [Kummerowia striata luteovirus]|nr:hypothetical protein 2 [Kummerowia striata luteovirus]
MAKGSTRGLFRFLNKLFGKKSGKAVKELTDMTQKEAFELASLSADRARDMQKVDIKIAGAEAAAGLGVFTGVLDSQTSIFGSKGSHPVGGEIKEDRVMYEPYAYAPVFSSSKPDTVYLPIEESDSSLSENFTETGLGCDLGCGDNQVYFGGDYHRRTQRRRKRRRRR